MASNSEWKAIAKRSLEAAAKVKGPEPPSAAMKAAFKAEKERLQAHFKALIPALKTAPIYIVSTHGAYDLRVPQEKWVVPPKTYIFETQTIGDTTLTKIDNLLWKLCLAENRPAFFHYFMGNRWFFNKHPVNPSEPSVKYIELFRNLILYKPGDEIYKRKLSIGGGHSKDEDGSARQTYVNMGFYKFSVNPPTPKQAPPKRSTKRPMVPTEIAELNDLRTTLIRDEDFSITNKDYVDLLINQKPIQYGGLKDGKTVLLPAQSFTMENDGEKIRIIIFSSCAAVNCNPAALPSNPYVLNPALSRKNQEAAKAAHKAAEDAAYEAAKVAAYDSDWCNDRIDEIETQQLKMTRELMQMGVNTGPGGSGWDYDIEHLREVISQYKLRTKTKSSVASAKPEEKFLPIEYEELYAELNSDYSDWWKQVERESPLPPDLNVTKKGNAYGGRRRYKKRYTYKN